MIDENISMQWFQLIVGTIFFAGLLIIMGIVYLNRTNYKSNKETQQILRLFGSLSSAIGLSFFTSGAMNIQLNSVPGAVIVGSGGLAVFILVWWTWGRNDYLKSKKKSEKSSKKVSTKVP